MSVIIRLALSLLCLLAAVFGGLACLYYRGVYSALLWSAIWSCLAELMRPSVDQVHTAVCNMREQLDGE